MADYSKIRKQTIEHEELKHLSIAALSLLLMIAAAALSWRLNQAFGIQIFLLAGVFVALLFAAAFIYSLALFLNVTAEKAANRNSIETLMRLLDKSSFRKEILSEMEWLLKEQGEIYQYQVYALILRARG